MVRYGQALAAESFECYLELSVSCKYPTEPNCYALVGLRHDVNTSGWGMSSFPLVELYSTCTREHRTPPWII